MHRSDDVGEVRNGDAAELNRIDKFAGSDWMWRGGNSCTGRRSAATWRRSGRSIQLVLWSSFPSNFPLSPTIRQPNLGMGSPSNSLASGLRSQSSRYRTTTLRPDVFESRRNPSGQRWTLEMRYDCVPNAGPRP